MRNPPGPPNNAKLDIGDNLALNNQHRYDIVISPTGKAKENMKKIALITLALLTACGEKENDTGTSADTGETPSTDN